MDDIAVQLAMSKKTLYKWFENKDELVQAVIKLHLQANECGCEEMSKKSENAVDELFRIMTLNKKFFSELHPSVFYDLQKFHPRAYNLFNEHKNNFILDHVKANIRRGMEEGLFRADLNIEVMGRLRLAQIEMVFNPDIFPAGDFNVGEVQMECLEHFMLGIATLKGHKLINQYKKVTEEA